MKTHPKLTLLLVLLIVTVVGTVMATLQVTQQGVSRSPALQKAAEDFYTVADYSGSEPSDPQKRATRRLRARRYNMQAGKGVDPKRFSITEERESSFGAPPTHAPVEPALPAAQSDAVVIGEVTGAKAFLTEDQTAVVSEFSVHVSDLLKENLLAPFSVGDSLDVIRSGGGVRFPSGKIIRSGQHGKPLPKLGQQYLFFLQYNNDGGQDYALITAYELEVNRVLPLDGLSLVNTVMPTYANYQRYKDSNAQAFLLEVRDAITRNLGAKPTRRESIR